MPDTTTSFNAPDPASWTDAGATRAALDSAPRGDALPDHALASDVPLPPPWPQFRHDSVGDATDVDGVNGDDGADDIDDADDADTEDDFGPRRPEDRATRPLFAPEQWVSDPDFWESKTHIALTGRHPIPRPKTVALEPPQRFHPMPRWRSMLVLILVCLLIAFTVVGMVELARLGSQALGPTHHVATPAPTHTLVAPTATPLHHKK